jgi:hypothetical protein
LNGGEMKRAFSYSVRDQTQTAAIVPVLLIREARDTPLYTVQVEPFTLRAAYLRLRDEAFKPALKISPYMSRTAIDWVLGYPLNRQPVSQPSEITPIHRAIHRDVDSYPASCQPLHQP